MIAPLPRADGSPAHGSLARVAAWPGRCTARSFADAWPPNLIRFRLPPRAASAARACPSPAKCALARPSASPGIALAHGARGRWRLAVILWLHHGRPKCFSPTDFVNLLVSRTTVGPRRSWTVEAKRVYGMHTSALGRILVL